MLTGEVMLKSWKGDYLHRPDSAQGVTSWNTGIGNKWTIVPTGKGTYMLKSWKGDYLHRPDSAQGVTSWSTGIGNEWTIAPTGKGTYTLKSWKGDYLHRPDSAQGVTSWSTGIGNEWTIEATSKALTTAVTGNGTVDVTFNSGGGVAYAYAFQQTGNDTFVSLVGPNFPAERADGTAGTGGQLTFLHHFWIIKNPTAGSTYTFSLSSGRLVAKNKILHNVADLEVKGTDYASTCVITCEDSSDRDYNDLTVVLTWFKAYG